MYFAAFHHQNGRRHYISLNDECWRGFLASIFADLTAINFALSNREIIEAAGHATLHRDVAQVFVALAKDTLGILSVNDAFLHLRHQIGCAMEIALIPWFAGDRFFLNRLFSLSKFSFGRGFSAGIFADLAAINFALSNREIIEAAGHATVHRDVAQVFVALAKDTLGILSVNDAFLHLRHQIGCAMEIALIEWFGRDRFFLNRLFSLSKLSSYAGIFAYLAAINFALSKREIMVATLHTILRRAVAQKVVALVHDLLGISVNHAFLHLRNQIGCAIHIALIWFARLCCGRADEGTD